MQLCFTQGNLPSVLVKVFLYHSKDCDLLYFHLLGNVLSTRMDKAIKTQQESKKMLCVCVLEVLTAVPDEHSLNISRISGNEAAGPYYYYTLNVVYHSNFTTVIAASSCYVKLRQKL